MLTLQIQNQTLENQLLELSQNLKVELNKLVEKFLSEKIKDISFTEWSENEINSIGKIGFHSSSFENDDEDYSKW